VTPIAAALSPALGDELLARLVEIGEHGAVAVHSVPALERLLPRSREPIVLVGGPWPASQALVTAAGQRRAPVLLLSDALPGSALEAALQDGVRAVLPVDINARTLRAALDAVGQGLTVLAGGLRPVLGAATEARAAEKLTPRGLTAREREILALIATGASNKTIARRLGVSPNTVKFHIVAVFAKLDAATRAEAVAKAARLGELSL